MFSVLKKRYKKINLKCEVRTLSPLRIFRKRLQYLAYTEIFLGYWIYGENEENFP